MRQSLQKLCPRACPIVTDCELRIRPQSVTCRDARTKSELMVRFERSAFGLAFVTDHVVPAGAELSCDWCVCHCDDQRTRCEGLLVELKGRNFKHAVEQLHSTLVAMRQQWCGLAITRCVAILSGKQIPSTKSTDYKVVGRYKLPEFKRFRARKGLSVGV